MNKITLPWPPKQLNPNYRPHWTEKMRFIKKYRANCYILMKQALMNQVAIELPKTDKLHLFVNFYRPDKRHRDQDNIEAMMKAAYDGIADALDINDSRFVIHPIVSDEIVKNGKVTITITSDPGNDSL